MNEPGVVDKVAARLTMDITPAQKALLTLSGDYENFNRQLQAAESSGTGLLMASEEERARKLKQMELDSASARLMGWTELYGKMEMAQTESNARIERADELHLQRLWQNEQTYQARMQQIQSRGAQSSGSSSSLTSSLTNRLSYMGNRAVDVAAGLTFYQLVAEMAKIPEIALQAQASMVKLEQVLELSPSQADLQRYGSLNGMLQQLSQVAGVMAETYGVDLNVVIDAMSMVGRKFKDVGDIVVATDTALQMYAVDNVPVATSVKSLEALMSQFGLNMHDARQALYELTAAAHSFQVTGTDLMSAIERSGASFNTMKMNTSESIAAISTLAQITAQSGNMIGNAWKSIEASMLSDKGVKALHQLGIEAYDANGNLKDGVTILQQLQATWPKLTDQAKIHFSEVLAGGRYQYERLLAFLNDYSSQYQRALTVINQANQQQQEQLVASALESPVKQLQMTKASFEVLANTIATQLNPTLIAFMTEMRQGTRYVNDHWQSIEHWLQTGASLAEAYVAWRVSLVAYNAVLNSSIVTQLRFNAGIFATINSRMGFTAALGAMGGAVAGFTVEVAAAVAKFAAFLVMFEVIQNVASRTADPLNAKIGDLQSRISSLNGAIADRVNGNFGAGDALQGWGNVLGDVLHGNIVGAGKAIDQLTRNGSGNVADLIAQKTELESQLQQAQQQKADQTKSEVQKSLDEVNKLVAQAMANAANATTNPKGSGNDTGTSIGVPGASGAGGGAAAFKQPFMDLTQADDLAIQQFTNRIRDTSDAERLLSQDFSNQIGQMRLHLTSVQQSVATMTAYDQEVQMVTAHQKDLGDENARIADMLPQLRRDMADVDAQFANGAITADEHRQAIQTLDSEYQRLTDTVRQNEQAIADDAQKMRDLANQMESQIIDTLKTSYEDLQKMEEDSLQKSFDASKQAIDDQITALDSQKNSIDAVIKSLQEQWAAQDAVNKLNDLQSQLAAVKADTSFRIVDQNGNVSWTYDTTKAASLQKQITDEQTKIAHDAQIKQLQDQKDTIDAEITNLRNQESALQKHYDDQKHQLDQYWQWKLQQDNLQSEADNLILKNGLDGAFQLVQGYAGKIIGQYQAIQSAAAAAAQAVANGLGGSGLPSSGGGGLKLNDYWQQVKSEGGAYSSPGAYGQTADERAAEEAAKYGISKSQVQITSGGHTFVPWQYVEAYLYRQQGAHMVGGGIVPYLASGIDNVPAWLTPGEIVVPSFAELKDVAAKAAATSLQNVNKHVVIEVKNVTVSDEGELTSFLDMVKQVSA